MPRATLNVVTLTESDHTEVVEGNHYFPKDAVKHIKDQVAFYGNKLK